MSLTLLLLLALVLLIALGMLVVIGLALNRAKQSRPATPRQPARSGFSHSTGRPDPDRDWHREDPHYSGALAAGGVAAGVAAATGSADDHLCGTDDAHDYSDSGCSDSSDSGGSDGGGGD